MRTYYFGCGPHGLGHFLWEENLNARSRVTTDGTPLPWDKIDCKLNPAGEIQGEAAVHHKDDWTALAFADRSMDRRYGSNVVFFIEGTWDFEQAVEHARRSYPEIWERFDYRVFDTAAGK